MFQQSKQLKEIIESHDWTLYQIPIRTAPSWEETESRGPAPFYDVGYDFMFAPIPQEGQTLREAYSLTKGLGPSLLIEPSWEGIEEVYRGGSSIERDNEILFSRLWFSNERSAMVISPKTRDNFDPSCVSIRLSHLVETFQKYFRIVKPEEYGLSTPIQMPFHPEYN